MRSIKFIVRLWITGWIYYGANGGQFALEGLVTRRRVRHIARTSTPIRSKVWGKMWERGQGVLRNS